MCKKVCEYTYPTLIPHTVARDSQDICTRLANHTLHREEGSGHAAAVAEEHNYQAALLDNKMLTSTKHVI